MAPEPPPEERSQDLHAPVARDPQLLERPEVRAARDFLLQEDLWVLRVQKELTAIPAPPFQEGPRGRMVAELFREVGLTRVRTDRVGNVLAELPPQRASSPSPQTAPLIVSAHLDTVFPPGTDVTPREEGDVIRAPGISDDGRGLAALVALARTLVRVPLPLPSPPVFVATVGEEGVGDLRGVRHLFQEGEVGSRAWAFISLDGAGLTRIIHQGVGSVRLRITAEGTGGHSWTDWGTPNPIHRLGRAVAGAVGLPLPTQPKTTLTVARWSGGRSINAIPEDAWVEVDLRSEDALALEALEGEMRRLFQTEILSPQAFDLPGAGQLRLTIEDLGRRPAGKTSRTNALVRAAIHATEAFGVEAELVSSSTDSNVPMALGIPAVTLGAGGEAGGIHTSEEWYRNEKGPEGILRALLTLILAGSSPK